MQFAANLNQPPIGGLIILKASKNDNCKITWGKENSLTGNGMNLKNITTIARYLAMSDKSTNWFGNNAIEEGEVNHWISFSIGPLSCTNEFNDAIAYMDKVLTPLTYFVGDQCTLADIAIFSSLLSNITWHNLIKGTKVPTNLMRWFKLISDLDFVKQTIADLPKDVRMAGSRNVETERKQEGKFVELPGAEMGKVVVRFPPEASGYLHIGHAKAALLNQYYKEAFNGKLIMRFDDTNPAKEKVDFEKVILEDLEMLQVKYDQFSHTSNYFDVMIEFCETLLKNGNAYVDDTDPEIMKTEREQKVPSKNRDNGVEKNMSMWGEMIRGTEYGQKCCVRAKIDMSSLNGCMRDPTIYRCKNEPHPKTGAKYKVYPTYDFACPIVDSIEGVTHCLRTMEYHDRDEQFYWFIDQLGLRKPHIWEYSRLNMINTVLSKRKLTWFVDQKYVEGWDDPRMPTVRGILRRGMTVEALKEFIIMQGSSRSVVVMEWDKIWAVNKKVIDPVAPRYSAVTKEDHVLVRVDGVKEEEMFVPKHPKNPDVGVKSIWVGPEVIVDQVDAQQFVEGENVTFINWGNIQIKKIIRENGRVTEVNAVPNLGDKNFKKTLKITWLAKNKNARLVPALLFYYDHLISKPILGKDEDFKDFINKNTLTKVKVWVDPELAKLQVSNIIQVQRKGFFICDKIHYPWSMYTGYEGPVNLIYIPDGHTKELPVATNPAPPRPILSSAERALLDKIKIQTYKIKEMQKSDPPQVVPPVEFRTLLNLNAEFKKLIKQHDSSGNLMQSVTSTKGPQTSKVEKPSTNIENKDVQNIINKIKVQGDKIRDLKNTKSAKDVIQGEVNILLSLKNEYKNLTGKEWTPEVNNAPEKTPTNTAANTSSNSAIAEIIEKIKVQGDKIRDLKKTKPAKEVIQGEVNILLSLKSEYKNLTGKEWTPEVNNAPEKTPQNTATQPTSNSAVSEVIEKIKIQGDKIRDLKKTKPAKEVIQGEVNILLSLKSEYKNLTGKEWTPEVNNAPEKTPQNTATQPTSNSAVSEVIEKIKIQGDKIRDLKKTKPAKEVIQGEVNILLSLKSEYKNLTGKEWTPEVNNAPEKTQNTATQPTSNSAVSEIIEKIKVQGDKIRDLKKTKPAKEVIQGEVNILLSLKSEYKNLTGKEWTPEVNNAPQKTPQNVATQPSSNSAIADIIDKIKIQGDKIRDLKKTKPAKDVIQGEVNILLSLKSEYKNLTGKEWTPEVNNAPEKASPNTVKSSADNEVTELTEKIKEQGDIVRQLKSKNSSKDEIESGVQKLLALKDQYKQMTGTDFPVEGRKSNKSLNKTKNDSQKNQQKQSEQKKESDSNVKKITRLGLEAAKEENLPEWYSQVLTKGELIEYYDVSGCYILRPWSFAIWENIKDWLDKEIKILGVKNCYFPIFVSRNVLEKEKTHISDFAPEVAWVTKSGDSDLAEPIAVRPTSETVMYPAYAKWVQSYRDLPIKLNQWNNVVRWEFKHPQPFLRTREFLWQEGHTAFATFKEAEEEVFKILDLYGSVYTDLLAIPVVKGRKTEKEKFAGGDFTLTVEAYISASGRAIQGATSHHLGQNFSKMFDIIYEDPETQEKKFVYQNSWGLTTRTIGVLIMVHADNQGLVLPPKIATIQIVIVPCGITVSLPEKDKEQLLKTCQDLKNDLGAAGLRAEADVRDNYSPGWKFNHWELKGVPIRVEMGPKDLQSSQIVAVRRDTGSKITLPAKTAVTELNSLLDTIQCNLLQKATAELNNHMVACKDWKDFCQHLDNKNIIQSPFCGEIDCEDNIKNDSARNEDSDSNAPSMGAKSLCIPFTPLAKLLPSDKCIHPKCSKQPKFYTLFGRSY